MSDQHNDIVRIVGGAAMKSAPPVAVTIWVWLGQNLPTLVGIATLLYLCLQGYLIWLRIRAQQRDNRNAARASRRAHASDDE